MRDLAKLCFLLETSHWHQQATTVATVEHASPREPVFCFPSRAALSLSVPFSLSLSQRAITASFDMQTEMTSNLEGNTFVSATILQFTGHQCQCLLFAGHCALDSAQLAVRLGRLPLTHALPSSIALGIDWNSIWSVHICKPIDQNYREGY